MFEIFKKGLHVPDVLERLKTKRVKIRDKYPHMVFSQPEVRRLLERAHKNPLIDKSLKTAVKTKMNKLDKLMGQEFANIKSEDATIEEIASYIKKLNNIENIDLDYQRFLASQKLSLIRIGQKYLDGSLTGQLQQL
jgi:hypothetical protein